MFALTFMNLTKLNNIRKRKQQHDRLFGILKHFLFLFGFIYC